MISFQEAFERVMQHSRDFGEENVPLQKALGRILAEAIVADRDFPPFDRATMDGIAIRFEMLKKGGGFFPVEGIAPAGTPQMTLQNPENCIEVMTGAMVPMGADTVLRYEDVEIKDDAAKIDAAAVISKGQSIHYQGSDQKKGAVLIPQNSLVSPPEIGILASVGKSEVQVKRMPKVALISTGDELVAVGEVPLPHQIRRSNTHTLQALLQQQGVISEQFHFKDDSKGIEHSLGQLMNEFDVLMLSGGVSKGKFDFVPEALDRLGVEKIFHRVAQRPGKPFWFGVHEASRTTVFSFPGNPVSTYANCRVYFLSWLKKSLGLPMVRKKVILAEATDAHPDLTLFKPCRLHCEAGRIVARLLPNNGSGDHASLIESDGFICLPPQKDPYEKDDLVEFV